MGGKCTAWTHCSVLSRSTTSQMIQVKVIQRLADVVEVKSSLALAQHLQDDISLETETKISNVTSRVSSEHIDIG